jgi:hypothetical protein
MRTCFVDSDSDGWGSGAAIPECRSSCAPGTSPLPGDCDDSDARAHPFTAGSPSPFQTRPRNGGGFDFDCNMYEEMGLPTHRNLGCAIGVVPGMCVGSGWMGPPPGCGLMGTYVECAMDTSAGRDECVALNMPNTTMPCR